MWRSGYKNGKKTKEQLIERFNELRAPELLLYSKGYKLIAGMDEVGRGPLAGPVVTACVILPKDFYALGIDDSKKVSENKREELYNIIIEKCVCYSIGMVEPEVIDEINILQATKLAMKKAFDNMQIKPDYLMIDAMSLPELDVVQEGIIKGDGKRLSIAAASILAKVTRDRLMREYDLKYPGYGFSSNKGYGTKEHYKGLETEGITEIHRLSFLKNIL